MSHAYSRMSRIGDQIQRELAEFLTTRAHDPRFHEVTIVGVDVAPDMASAVIFVSVLSEEYRQTLTALNKAAGFFRHHLAQELDLRITPRLKFVYDESLSRGNRISQLINEKEKSNQETKD